MSYNQFPLVNALGRAKELAAWLDQCEYEDEISATMGGEIAALLRAQSAELLALRAALTNCLSSATPHSEENPAMFRAWKVGRALLNSPTQGAKSCT